MQYNRPSGVVTTLLIAGVLGALGVVTFACKPRERQSDLNEYDIRFGGKWQVVGIEDGLVKLRSCTQDEYLKAREEGKIPLTLSVCRTKDTHYDDLPVDTYRMLLGSHFSTKDMRPLIEEREIARIHQKKYLAQAGEEVKNEGEIDVLSVPNSNKNDRITPAAKAEYKALAAVKAKRIKEIDDIEAANKLVVGKMEDLLKFMIPVRDANGRKVELSKMISPDSWEYVPLMFPFKSYAGEILKPEEENLIKQALGLDDLEGVPFRLVKALGDPSVIQKTGIDQRNWFYKGAGQGAANPSEDSWIEVTLTEAMAFCNEKRPNQAHQAHLPTLREVAAWYVHRKFMRDTEFGLHLDGSRKFFWTADLLNKTKFPRKTDTRTRDGYFLKVASQVIAEDMVKGVGMSIGSGVSFAPYDGATREAQLGETGKDVRASVLCSSAAPEFPIAEPASLNLCIAFGMYSKKGEQPGQASTWVSQTEAWLGEGEAQAKQAAMQSCEAFSHPSVKTSCKVECKALSTYL